MQPVDVISRYVRRIDSVRSPGQNRVGRLTAATLDAGGPPPLRPRSFQAAIWSFFSGITAVIPRVFCLWAPGGGRRKMCKHGHTSNSFLFHDALPEFPPYAPGKPPTSAPGLKLYQLSSNENRLVPLQSVADAGRVREVAESFAKSKRA